MFFLCYFKENNINFVFFVYFIFIKMIIFKSSFRILYGFYYDFNRFFRYGGWKKLINLKYREYLVVRIYYKLEKCMSFSDR